MLTIPFQRFFAVADLCKTATCPKGTGCKLVEVCTPQCAVVETCATPASTAPLSNPCKTGTPLITTAGYEKVCVKGGNQCPERFTCALIDEDDQGRCCQTEEQTQTMVVKRGKCPNPTMFGVCFNFCTDDRDCRGNQKCCFNGCGKSCMVPMDPPSPRRSYITRGRTPSQKSNYHSMSSRGICPNVMSIGPCVNTCTFDTDCGQGRKCCSNGCGYTCQLPVLPSKSGMCPKRDNNYMCSRSTICEYDIDCSESEKCCTTQCGQRCMPTNTQPHPGLCPISHHDPDSVFGCSVRFDACLSDPECPTGMKCCGSGCGNRCQTPHIRPISVRHGTCPVPEENEYFEGSSLCLSLCRSDEDCPMSHKCCLRGDRCSYICTHTGQ